MPTFPFVDHAWAVSALFSFLYPLMGKIGLSVVFSFLAVLTLLLIYPKKSTFSFFFLLAASSIGSFVGIRAQVVTWVFFAVFLCVINNIKLWNKFKFFTPLFFLLWANIHGGFASGLIALTAITFFRQIQAKKYNLSEAVLVATSIFATLINPYHFGLWKEVWSSVSDNTLRWSISEWQPILLIFNLPILVYTVFSSFFIYKERKNLKFDEIIICLIFFIQSLISVRHFPLFVIVSFPVFIKSIGLTAKKISKIASARERLQTATKYLYRGVVFLFLVQMFLNLNGSARLGESKFYPGEAVKFLKNNLPQGQIFSIYDWGGYLIWKLPEKKVFIDGRMPSWRRISFPANETASAFDDTTQIFKGKLNYQDVFSKFQINTVLLRKEKPTKSLITVRITKEPKFNFEDKLKEDGWKEVYIDDVSSILLKP